LELTATVFYDELVARCKEGDAQSYEQLYHRYARAMFNTSLRIVNNTADAEDVLQESFLSAFKLDHFDYSSTFGAWLKRIVINKSIDLLRRKRMQIVHIDEAAVDREEEPDAADEGSLKLKVEEIKKAMAQLPDGYRTVLSLSLFEGYDYDEIAGILGITASTVRTQFHRARKKLLQLLKKGGDDA